MSHLKTSLLRPSSGWHLIRVVGFKPKSLYVFAAPKQRSACHSCCQASSFRLFNSRFALLRDCVSCVVILGGVLAWLLASLSAISFPSIPIWPGIHCIDILFPVWSQFFAVLRNRLKTSWLDPFGLMPALRATLRLSRQMCNPGDTRAIGLFKAASNPPRIALASASYTSCVSPNGFPYFEYQPPTQLIAHPAPVLIGFPSSSVPWDPSVYITISNRCKFLSHKLKFVAAISLFPVPQAAGRQLSAPPNKCTSQGSESSKGSENSTLAEHFFEILSSRVGWLLRCASLVFLQRRCLVSSLWILNAASSHKKSSVW